MRRKAIIGSPRLVVVKVGSALLIRDDGGGVDHALVGALAEQIAALRAGGTRVVVVSSGAIALGMAELGMAERPRAIDVSQALAAIGQSEVMRAWRRALGAHGITAAQVLLTRDDLQNRRRYLNARYAMQAMLDLGAVPVVNENDTVAIEEIKLGDNDMLAANVATFLAAGLLVMLTTPEGLFDRDPTRHRDARRVPIVEQVDERIEAMVASSKTAVGVGGMATKIQAARSASHFGIPTIIASGRTDQVIQRAFRGGDVGTLVAPHGNPVSSRKHWIAYSLEVAGAIEVDDGAAYALTEAGKSLLPSGIVRCEGTYGKGAAVRVVDAAGRELARGLVAYSSDEIARIAGLHSSQIEGALGYRYADEVIHRDDLVIRSGADFG